MNYSIAATELIFVQNPQSRKSSRNRKFDLWQEVTKRSFAFGVTITLLLAVLAPRIGSPGGLLHLEYVLHIPQAFIYYKAGCHRAHLMTQIYNVALWRLCMVEVFHAHMVTVAVSIVLVGTVRAAVDHRIVQGVVFSSVGGPSGWLSISLTHTANRPDAVLLTLVSYIASMLLAPLTIYFFCGDLKMPPLHDFLINLMSTLLPFTVGSLLRKQQSDQATQQKQCDIKIKCCALFLLYGECCTRLYEAEGIMMVGDVLITMFIVISGLIWSIALCWLYYHFGLLKRDDLNKLVLCAVPKTLHTHYHSCTAPGLARLFAAISTPAQALFLANINTDDKLEDGSEGPLLLRWT